MQSIRTTFVRQAALAALLLTFVVSSASAQLKITNAAASAGVNAITSLINVGGTGTLDIRTDACPATADDSPAGTLLVTLDFDATAFGAASNGVATAASISTENAVASGIAACAYLKSGAGTVIAHGSVATSGAFLNLVNTSIASGQPVSVTSMTLTLPKS
jgi:hypothetical protein